jgi:hypothetical protein
MERTAPKDFITQAEAGYHNNFKRLHLALCGRVRALTLGGQGGTSIRCLHTICPSIAHKG